MNKLTTIVGSAVLLLVFGFYMCSFQVRSTEIAVLKTFGKFEENDIKTEPQLYFKWFWPIQSVVVTDNRTRVLKDTYEETPTRDSQNLMVTTYTCWRIDEDNPYRFHIANSSSEKSAEQKLRSLIQAQKKIVIANHELSDLVNTDDSKFKFDQIEDELLYGDPENVQTKQVSKLDVSAYLALGATLGECPVEGDEGNGDGDDDGDDDRGDTGDSDDEGSDKVTICSVPSTMVIAKMEYGIEIQAMGIRRLSFPKSVSEKIFERMKAHEQKKAAKYETEGEAQAQAIIAEASAVSRNILAVADRLAEQIKAEAKAEVGEYYKEFDEHAELRLFLDRLEATVRALQERTTIIMDSAFAPFNLFDIDPDARADANNGSEVPLAHVP